MSWRYLPGHAKKALLALELARKESAHMQYTHRTLLALPIDAACSLATKVWAGYAWFPKTRKGFADVL